MGHINVAETNINEVENNLNLSFEIIQDKCGDVKHFAYPYGRFHHFNLPAFDLVFRAGYQSCATAERGCHISNQKLKTNELLIRRDHVVCDWNLNHIMYFILDSSRNCSIENNINPYI
jgi:hypothetical protein